MPAKKTNGLRFTAASLNKKKTKKRRKKKNQPVCQLNNEARKKKLGKNEEGRDGSSTNQRWDHVDIGRERGFFFFDDFISVVGRLRHASN